MASRSGDEAVITSSALWDQLDNPDLILPAADTIEPTDLVRNDSES